ncbi:protein of unknown function [Taphrina deformans PYCC 5710]|uniref:Integral membrane protein n=1 Tax=Taphrina deformans (strain PYCC 5710 / ATCC 11124 / CBS 356.35 / IMI 108563 / JCM 9778 / NBRC 8474) TaxID=1097556 RepID=R4XDP9_TAPDE|nr:protein of unknown function [Taphrina deformans PYCC 5710]|eukprot:CCG84001.1 protein of unknown function [Taphrina deformans PYCC 5710]
MCRGSLVLFVGLFSVFFLGRRLLLHQWIALLLVTIGVFIVGLSNVYHGADSQSHVRVLGSEAIPKAQNALLGITLIVGAQLFTASQFVIEEWVLSRYAIEPLKVAGMEGAFGTLISAAGILIAYYSYGRTPQGMNGTFDVSAGMATILSHNDIWTAFVLFAISIATFNFCGLSVTRNVSATSRSTIDTCRTLLIWTISMLLGWEHFKWLQLLGFAVLVYATLLFNGVIPSPPFLTTRQEPEVQTGREHVLE